MIDESGYSFSKRWWVYQKERFPVLTFAPLLFAFSFSGVCLSRLMGGINAWPAVSSTLTAFACVFLFFLQLRFLDEYKDYETDKTYRPERAVPRGLIPLAWIGRALALTALIQLALTLALKPYLVFFLVAVWCYMALMTVEFLVPEWIKPRLVTYMWSHMLIMPIIDFFATGCDWALRQGLPPAGLLLFLAVSFFNGILIELGRKTWAPDQERKGVDSYSAYLGLDRALALFTGALLLSYAGTLGVGAQVHFLGEAAVGMTLMLLVGAALLLRFHKERSSAWAKRLELFSGLWVIAGYLIMGVLPLWKAL